MAGTLTIGQVAKTTGMSAKTIRYYEAVGVLPPANRSAAGYRQYSPHGAHRVLFVRRARALGMSLRHLKPLVAALDDGPRATLRPRLLELVRAQLSVVQQQISDLRLLERQLEQVIHRMLRPRSTHHAEGCRCLEIEGVPPRGATRHTRSSGARPQGPLAAACIGGSKRPRLTQ